MNISFHTGVSGLSAYQEGLNMVANNIANVNTFGYKPINPSFKDLVYTNMDTNNEKKFSQGHGVKLATADLIYKQGNPNQTGRELDFAIVGDGFFAVEDMGITKYTRNGAFALSVEGDASYLTNSDGAYILDGDGERIEATTKTVESADGKTTEQGIDYEALQEKIGIYRFPNPFGLTPMSGGNYLPNQISGQAEALTDENRESVDLLARTIELSAVDLADTMAAMMITQKAYQFSAKIVQTADQIEEIVNNLR